MQLPQKAEGVGIRAGLLLLSRSLGRSKADEAAVGLSP